ncbi:MAG: hypothetical protein KKC46_12365, partial [Proteobacteria bacterium]|nr:hypothetical protein [Pseudomonadota bacterium]
MPNGALSMLEPCEVKVSCMVLRGESSRKAADLPGGPHQAVHEDNRAVAGSRLQPTRQLLQIDPSGRSFHDASENMAPPFGFIAYRSSWGLTLSSCSALQWGESST